MAPTALKVAAPGSLSKDEAVQLLQDLVDGFGSREFQVKLGDWRLRYASAAPGKEKNKLGAERSKLFLEVQGSVLPQYGFSGDAKGVFQMWQAMQPHNADGDWLLAAGMMNLVCGQDGQGQPVEPSRPSAARTYARGEVDGGTSFVEGETNISRFSARSDLDGLFPFTAFYPLDNAIVHGDLILSVWSSGVVALTLELDVKWRWKMSSPMDVAALGSRMYAINGEGVAFCFCLDSGSEVWRRRYAPSGNTVRTTVTQAAGGLYLVPGWMENTQPGHSNGVYALSLADGSEVWRVCLAPCALEHSHPTLAGEHVLVRDLFGGVACLLLTTGALQWYSAGVSCPRPAHLSAQRAAVSLSSNLVCVCRIPAKEVVWNKPSGGAGLVVALELDSGRKRWEQAFELEAHASPVILAGRGLVVACLGNKCGPPEGREDKKVYGDSFPGMIVGLRTTDGAHLWSWEPPVLASPTCAGCASEKPEHMTWLWESVSPWTYPVVDAEGRIFTCFHNAIMYIIDAKDGQPLGYHDACYATKRTLPVALGDGVLLLVSGARTHVFRWPQPGPSIAQPLAAPFQDTGTEHFFPSKNSRNEHTLTCTSSGPVDLTTPAWSFESPCGNRSFPFMSNNFYCNPLIDSQRNLYNVTELGWLYVHRSDGTLRGSVYVGLRASTPVIEGTELYCANADGYAMKLDLETLEFIWIKRYCSLTPQDTWMPSLSTEMVILGGITCRGGLAQPWLDPEGRGLPPDRWENNWWVFALDRTTGETKWVFTPFWMVYNLNPTFLTFKGEHEVYEVAVIIDNIGGLYFVDCRTGTLVWHRFPTSLPPTFHDICGVTYGPNQLVYFGCQDPTVNVTAKVAGKFPQQPGIVEAFDVSNWPPTKKWDVKLPFAGMLQSVLAPVGSGKYVLVLPMGWNGALPSKTPNDPEQPEVFQGIIYGLDSETGEELWSFSPPPWRTETGSCRGSTWWACYLPASWCSPVVDGNGTLYIYWHSGVMYAIEAATGRVKSRYDLGCSVTGSPAVAPGLLVIQAQHRVLVWRDEELEDKWLAEAKAADDPRAKVGRVGCGTSEEAKQRGILWGMGRFSEPHPDVADDGPAADSDSPKPAPAPAPDAKAKALAKPAEAGQRYVVVGGAKSGGISVRNGASLKTEELAARLATGAEIREVAAAGDRIQYEKVSGEGPERGWVSKSFKGTALLRPLAP